MKDVVFDSKKAYKYNWVGELPNGANIITNTHKEI